MTGSAEKLSGVIVRQLIDGGALCSEQKPADSKQVTHWEFVLDGFLDLLHFFRCSSGVTNN
jgi:hypothetical protein